MSAERPDQFGAYRIISRLGRGAMAHVYHARDARERDVALKIMLPELAADESAQVRFVREAEAMAGLKHRNIITVLDCGVHDDSPYIAMELLKGESLKARLVRRDAMSLESKLDIVVQLCEGLQFAHDRGIVHRDVKPANIWLLENAGVKLLDFGIAKIVGSTLTRVGDLVGSAAYMSPEQVAGTEVDGRSDIFAAGVILYELLAGRRPFEAENLTGIMNKILHDEALPLRSLVPAISLDIEAAVRTALEKDVDARYAQAADFGADLRLARYSIEEPSPGTVIVPRFVSDSTGRGRSVDWIGTTESAAMRPTDLSGSGVDRTTVSQGSSVSRPVDGGARAPQESGIRNQASELGTVPPPAPLSAPAGARSAASPPAARRPTAVAPALTEPARVGHAHTPSIAERLRRASGDVRSPAWLPASAGRAVLPLAGLVAVLVLGYAFWGFWRTTPPAELTLDVRSAPAGASIAFDGVQTGRRTPAVLTVTARPGRIGLMLDGFETVDAPIRETANANAGGASAQDAAGRSSPLELHFTLRRLLRIQSKPAGARIIVAGRDTGLVTPAALPVSDPPPPSVELQLGNLTKTAVVTPAVLSGGDLLVVLSDAPRTASAVTASGAPPLPLSPATPRDSRAPGAGSTTMVSVRVTGAYPFAISGCGTTSADAPDHDLEVAAPCMLRLRAPAYYLDTTRAIDASSGRVEIAAPQLAHVQLRSRYEVCTIILDGRAVGTPPVDLELAAGSYTATIQCPDKTYYTKSIPIEPGRTIRRLDEFLR
jgi:serine/threonine protein kinase